MTATSGDYTARLWDLDTGHAVERICAATQGVLTPRQWHQHLPLLPYKPPCG